MNRSRNANILFAIVILIAVFPLGFLSAQNNHIVYPPDIQRIKDRGAFIVAMTAEDQPPFFYRNSKGKLEGLDVDIAQAIANGLGVRLEFNRSAQSFNDLIPIVASGKADAVISKLSRTLSRAQLVSFSHPYIVFHQALILNRLELAKKAPTTDDIVDFIKNFTGKIGVIAGSSYVAYARHNFPHAIVVQYPTWDDVVNAVFNGSILAAYRDEMEIKKIIRSRPDAALKMKTVVLTDTQDDIAIAVAWQNTHLLSWINLLLDNMNLNLDADKLLDRYPDIFKTGN
ncbi:MAG TPA: ABC transporter substrate-binding protein [Spirochaetia bacterium]|nr:ABC transporter substrate-binding protein [Spirochaetia bacterium]